MHKLAKDHTGKRYGRLTGVAPTTERRQHAIVWRWRCDCGNEVLRATTWVTGGNTKSCGCLQREAISLNNRKHGKTNHPLHSVWKGIRQRCQNSSCNSYKDYGGRGITVCAEWQEFEHFFLWAMGSGYKPGLTIERKDVNKGYCPDNCTWIPPKMQACNRRSSKLTEDDVRSIKKDKRPATTIAKDYGVSDAMIGKIRRGVSWGHIN